MGTLGTILALGVGGIITLLVGLQVVIRLRARAQQGKPVPPLPGALGKHVSKGRPALVYFHSPGCAACRLTTPQVEALRRKNQGVYLVDVSQQLDTARALAVMATPTFVEIEQGRITGYHIGTATPALLEKYA